MKKLIVLLTLSICPIALADDTEIERDRVAIDAVANSDNGWMLVDSDIKHTATFYLKNGSCKIGYHPNIHDKYIRCMTRIVIHPSEVTHYTTEETHYFTQEVILSSCTRGYGPVFAYYLDGKLMSNDEAVKGGPTVISETFTILCGVANRL